MKIIIPYIISQEYQNFGFFNIKFCFAVYFLKHESPFGPLAAWVRVLKIKLLLHKNLEWSVGIHARVLFTGYHTQQLDLSAWG